MLTYEKVIMALIEKFTKDMTALVEASEPSSMKEVAIQQHLLDKGIFRLINDTKQSSYEVGMKTALMELCNDYYDRELFRTDVMGRIDADTIYRNVCSRPISALKSEYEACLKHQDTFVRELEASFNAELLAITSALSNLYEDIGNKLENAKEDAEDNHEGGLTALINHAKDKENLKEEIRAAQLAVSEGVMREKFSEFMQLVPLVFNAYFHNILAAGRTFFEASASAVKDDASSDETIIDNEEKYEADIALYKQAIETPAVKS